MRVRGLKLALVAYYNATMLASHPVRVRGLKPPNMLQYPVLLTSHPVRVRGLKLGNCTVFKSPWRVAPRAGAWVETWTHYNAQLHTAVAPRAGAWVETDL